MINLENVGRIIGGMLMATGVWWIVLTHPEVFAIGVGLLLTIIIAGVIIELYD